MGNKNILSNLLGIIEWEVFFIFLVWELYILVMKERLFYISCCFE